MAVEFCLRNISIHARKVLLHAENLRGQALQLKGMKRLQNFRKIIQHQIS
jgi:hypothetical protein